MAGCSCAGVFYSFQGTLANGGKGCRGDQNILNGNVIFFEVKQVRLGSPSLRPFLVKVKVMNLGAGA